MADGGAGPAELDIPIMRKRTGKVESFSLSISEFNELYAGRYPAGIEFYGEGDKEYKRPFAAMTMKQVQTSLGKASLMNGRFVTGKDTETKFWITVPEGYWVCSIPAAARKR